MSTSVEEVVVQGPAAWTPEGTAACSDQAMCAETPGKWMKMAENGFRMILSLIGNATLGILWAIPQVAPGRQMTQMTQMTPQKTAQARAWTKTLRYCTDRYGRFFTPMDSDLADLADLADLVRRWRHWQSLTG